MKILGYRIAEDVMVPLKRVWDQAQRDIPSTSTDEFHSCRNSMIRRRSKLLPRMPRNVEDVSITGPWAETWSGKQHLQYFNNDLGVAVFSTKMELKLLQKCKVVLADGTFKFAHKTVQTIFCCIGNW